MVDFAIDKDVEMATLKCFGDETTSGFSGPQTAQF
jgi:hypothetical protein|tara:strand:- start:1175 stop:1279 length:105 start_codon:yes stop_codon:yes gene_type:complete